MKKIKLFNMECIVNVDAKGICGGFELTKTIQSKNTINIKIRRFNTID